MEKNKIGQPLMDETTFKEYVHNIAETNMMPLHLKTYEAVSRFKSIRKAIRKGLVSPEGYIYPKRPFNNARHSKRKGAKNLNDIKKMLYFQYKNGRQEERV